MDTNAYKIRPSPVTITELETLYKDFKHSIPDGMKYRHNYFKALSVSELSPEDMIQARNRQKAKECLERAILDGIMNKSLTWTTPNWFWQSQNDKDFVILKKWIA